MHKRVIGSSTDLLYTVYLIIDPRDRVPVYVGQSLRFEARCEAHLKCAKAPPINIVGMNIKVYLKQLLSIGYAPAFKIVHSCGTEDESLRSETEWVRGLIKEGYPLLNNWKIHKKTNKDVFGEQYKWYFREKLAANIEALPAILEKYRRNGPMMGDVRSLPRPLLFSSG